MGSPSKSNLPVFESEIASGFQSGVDLIKAEDGAVFSELGHDGRVPAHLFAHVEADFDIANPCWIRGSREFGIRMIWTAVVDSAGRFLVDTLRGLFA